MLLTMGLLLTGCAAVAGTPIAADIVIAPAASDEPTQSGEANPLLSQLFSSGAEASGAEASGAGGADTGTATETDAGTDDEAADGSPSGDADATTSDVDSIGDPTDYPSGDGVDPCGLITQADAERLAGTPLDAPVPGDHACVYTGPVTGPTAQVEIYVGQGAQKQLDIERTLDHELTELPDIADEAWLSDTGGYARVGQLWVSVLVVLLEEPSQYASRLTDAVTTAAGRL